MANKGIIITHSDHSHTLQDSIIASSLISAPAWGAWLSELNGILTTISLLIGLAIGMHRLVQIVKDKSSQDKK